MNHIVIADTNALLRLLDPRQSGHKEHARAFSRIEHLVISPFVLAELDHLVSSRSGAKAALVALRFIGAQTALRKFSVPDVAPHLPTALAVAEGYQDTDGGKGVGLADAMNVALAAAYQTDAMFTTDRHFRILRPLTGHKAFRLLPDDL
ncbi:PIN domain-containing protein [Streptomyces kebangsaanensis]|uniref:PIN domain-containing protein n=1 Tax=Streptomyces kebangsaanensis TaxID=864058 RepID=UPI00093FA6EF|nr:PIN domain-containing protein [Streptomyces kebangsaanensis]